MAKKQLKGRARFVISNTNPAKAPAPKLPEYAFIGRSNVGKSSLINMIVGMSGLAKTSSTPGKTKLINHFIVDESWYLVDLPGYGYARTSKSSKEEFSQIIFSYISQRENLLSLFVLIDVRLEPQAIDQKFLRWLGENQVPFIIVFTKADKLSHNQLQKNLAHYKKVLREEWDPLPPILVSSSELGIGKDEILEIISNTNRSFRPPH